jgi:NAD(P)-dependent dehydrogenase (short-subunit alcohol dehydrogenase family)
MNKSKIVLITGCSRGLGRAMVDSFANRDGYTVIGCARDQKTIDELQTQYPGPHYFEAVDVSEDSSVKSFAQSVLKNIGAPDLVLNNAAIINRNAPLWEISADEFNALTNININGVANVIRHLVPAMIKNERGVIVNFSSGWGRSTSPEVAPYCATKYAIEGMTSALAQELPPGLAAVALSPGMIDTDMLRSAWQESASEYQSPEEWAQTAVPYIEKLGPKDNGRSLSTP